MYDRITLLYSRNEHNIVNQLCFNKIKLKKEFFRLISVKQQKFGFFFLSLDLYYFWQLLEFDGQFIFNSTSITLG